MKNRSFSSRLVLTITAILGLVVVMAPAAGSAATAAGTAGPGQVRPGPANLSPELLAAIQAEKQKALRDGASTTIAGLLVEGFNNINFGGERIVDLTGPLSCSSAGNDLDYGVQNLGNNKNSLSSMRVLNPYCVVVLFDGPGYTGANWTVFTYCPNLGSCNGHNLWKRANSFYLT